MLKTAEERASQPQHTATGVMHYAHTTESLPAIMAGMLPDETDTILAVGGSGDQAFALLENAGEVRVVDENPLQVDYIRLRKELLQGGNFHGFLRPPGYPGGTGHDGWRRHRGVANYFGKRMARIRERLGNLVIHEPEDVFSLAARETGLTKIYLSNVLPIIIRDPRTYSSGDLSRCSDKLRVLGHRLPHGGIIYTANAWNTSRPRLSRYEPEHYRHLDRFLGGELQVDHELTEAARNACRAWIPIVYRKVAHDV